MQQFRFQRDGQTSTETLHNIIQGCMQSWLHQTDESFQETCVTPPQSLG